MCWLSSTPCSAAIATGRGTAYRGFFLAITLACGLATGFFAGGFAAGFLD